MKKIDFNKEWTYKRMGEEKPSRCITIPHDAMLGEMRTKQSAGGIHTGWYEGYDYLYTKQFEVPLDYKDKKIVFEFEGVYRNAEVSMNGKKVGFRPYGYSNFYVETEGVLKYGQSNTIEVIARNADQPNSRWYSGAGIYRPVYMYVLEKEHILINGVKIRTVQLNPAVIEVNVKTSGAGKLEIEVLEGGLSIVKKSAQTTGDVTIQCEVPHAKLWNCETPNLYKCKVKFGEDEVEESFGIRTLQWDEEKGISINNERVILRGACIHHDNGILGACAYKEAEERKIRILKENGYNAIRSAHNPCSKALLDACDKLGMLVMDEYVDVWYIHKTKYDYVNYFKDWWQKDLEDLVNKDYNHPSVIMYSTGNEVSETAEKKGIKITGDMTRYLHQLDETRPVTCGINIFFNFLSSIGFGVYTDEKANKGPNNSQKKKSVGSEFYNNLAGVLGASTMKIGATLYPCDLKTRDAFENLDIAGYNYAITRYKHDLKKYPKRLILGSETFCSDAYTFWEMAKANPRIVGDFVWAGMDYLGEVGIGAWEYDDYAPKDNQEIGWVSAGSGRIDLVGTPLAEAAYTKVAFELEKNPRIAVRPVNHTKSKHSPSAWKMSNCIESWAWNGCDGNEAYVEVYARANKVKLFINGKQVGEKVLKKGCLTSFNVTYESGEITAVSYDKVGKEIGKSTLRTAKEETMIHIMPEVEEVNKDGLYFIRLAYTDREGIVKPLEKGTLRLEVEGGELIGFGNGCPFNKRGYLTNYADTYYGRALAIVRAMNEEELQIRVTDGKLQSEWKSSVRK
jgi:beta-galactosidase